MSYAPPGRDTWSLISYAPWFHQKLSALLGRLLKVVHRLLQWRRRLGQRRQLATPLVIGIPWDEAARLHCCPLGCARSLERRLVLREITFVNAPCCARASPAQAPAAVEVVRRVASLRAELASVPPPEAGALPTRWPSCHRALSLLPFASVKVPRPWRFASTYWPW